MTHDPEATGYGAPPQRDPQTTDHAAPVDAEATQWKEADPEKTSWKQPPTGSVSTGTPTCVGATGQLPRRFGQYELVQFIAKGGMGVVYKARQLGPDGRPVRTVAVKMILAGAEASGEVIARFRTEAELASQLDHPHIVPIYEVGEIDGQPFYSMGYVEGGSLHELVKSSDQPLPPPEAARVVQQVAEAVEVVHRAGTIHRDIKPHNILLQRSGDSDASGVERTGTQASSAVLASGSRCGQPKLTDFGLARTREGSGTATGEQLGTPSYMAPEQAAGKVRELGPATDVYGLGAVLYYLLTGRPPFQSADKLHTMKLVLEQEPVSPRELNPAVPRDLETVCLKCLHKESARRYASARELAEDLGRFAAGQPVLARPVSRTERAWRWCRRNAALASALGTAAAALVLGTVVATWFGLAANEARAEAVRRAEAESEAHRQAKRNEEMAQQEKAAAEAARDELVTSVANHLLRPLALDVLPGKEVPPLRDSELEALLELANAKTNIKLRMRFVEEAVRTPTRTGQLRVRAVYALQAAVGLDEQCRECAEEILKQRLISQEVADGQRFDLVQALIALGGMRSQTARIAAQILTQDMSKETNTHALGEYSVGLAAVVTRLEPQEASLLLNQAMGKVTDISSLRKLSTGLVAVAARLEAREAFLLLTQAMNKAKNASVLRELTVGLSTAAERLEPRAAVRLFTQVLNDTTDAYALRELSVGLATVAARLEPREAANACGKAAALLTQVLNLSKESDHLEELFVGLAAVATRIEPREATRMLSQAMSETENAYALKELSVGLATVAAGLEPREAANACAQAATLLTQAMSKTTVTDAKCALSVGLAAVAARLESRAASSLMTTAMSETTDRFVLKELSAGLAALASRLEAHDLKELTTYLIRALSQRGNYYAMSELSVGLVAVAARLDPREAKETVRLLVRDMSKATDSLSLRALAIGLSTVAASLDPQEAGSACGQAATLLTQAMSQLETPSALSELSVGLAAVAVRLGPREAKETLSFLIRAMSKARDAYALKGLTVGLVAIAERLDDYESAKACSQAAMLLNQAIRKGRDPHALRELSMGLATVAARLEPQEAAYACAQAVTVLTQAMSLWTSQVNLRELYAGLAALVANFDPHEAATLLTQAMSKTTDSDALRGLAKRLWAVLSKTKACDIRRRASAVVAVVGCSATPRHFPTTVGLLQPTLAPLPARDRDQELVDLLKHPLCVGSARRVILDLLQNRHGRSFTDQWDFVRFAKAQNLGLDFTTPPARR